MKVIDLKYPYDLKKLSDTHKVVLALGFFDGVHLGHQKVISEAKKTALRKKLPLAVMTFDKHASEVFSGPNEPFKIRYLCNLSQKKQLLENAGVDILYVVDFTRKFAVLSPYEFVEDFIVRLNSDSVVAGFDYTFGNHGTANMEKMRMYSEGRFNVTTVPKETYQGEKISSTLIRQLIKLGEISFANELLGYAYEIEGNISVRKGKQSFNKFSLKNEFQVRPADGIYSGEAETSMGKFSVQIKMINNNVEISSNVNKLLNGENIKIRFFNNKTFQRHTSVMNILQRLN
ncbi:FAD synthetase family protein [Liquorilactobacillus mali]|uniref:FAD synthase n=1 Tax=Liquorilactobacillus mali KCTC 3596 = DSM 20444 TaxID=1046596 RepID=J0USN2_9LACO|nr:FAD synthetase family protein [Liquorilactobacillus mali]EJE99958.1 riboflavin biosynthesis protein RibF [Liquorilactobacillus mali KCTC 3596 = DSM 20444]KRN11257.1 riboflavin biosynthesis protein RibF [Liquorilactobacillus mali KCTC 3596 = DSM 20444]QFQ73756.1 FAD synthetase family protein [Liquorilactobacillus mali]